MEKKFVYWEITAYYFGSYQDNQEVESFDVFVDSRESREELLRKNNLIGESCHSIIDKDKLEDFLSGKRNSLYFITDRGWLLDKTASAVDIQSIDKLKQSMKENYEDGIAKIDRLVGEAKAAVNS